MKPSAIINPSFAAAGIYLFLKAEAVSVSYFVFKGSTRKFVELHLMNTEYSWYILLFHPQKQSQRTKCLLCLLLLR